MDEVQAAVWNLSPSSAASPDGFPCSFYRHFWDVIRLGVLLAVQEFFLGIPIPKAMAASLICLLPKTANPTTFADYRPIRLTNFLSKVVTRIISTS